MKKAGAILIVFLLAVMVLTACGLTTREPIPAPTVVPVTVTPTVSPAIPEPVILFPDATDTLALFTTYLEANSDLSAWLEEGYGYSLNQPGVLLAAGAGPCFWISTKDRAGITQTEWQGMNAEEQKRWFRTHFFKNALVINSEAEAVFSVLSEEEVDNAMRVQSHLLSEVSSFSIKTGALLLIGG